jgi:hypothetical protein
MGYEQTRRKVDTSTIAVSTKVGTAINLKGKTAVALIMPAAFSGTEITFQGSTDGSTYTDIISSAGATVTITVAASKTVVLDEANFYGVDSIKVLSVTTQAAERAIKVVLRGF